MTNPTEKCKVAKTPFLSLKDLKCGSNSEIEANVSTLCSLKRLAIFYSLFVIDLLSLNNVGGLHCEKLQHFLTEFTNIYSPSEYRSLISMMGASGLLSINKDENSRFYLVSLSNKKVGEYSREIILKQAPGFAEHIPYLSALDLNRQVEVGDTCSPEGEVKH